MPSWSIALGACSRLEPQPKLRPATMMSPFLTLSGHVGTHLLEGELPQSIVVIARQAFRWDDLVCVHMVAESPDLSICILHLAHSLRSWGLTILPATALAATTAGPARYTSDPLCPILPMKLRLVVDTHLSPLASTPM